MKPLQFWSCVFMIAVLLSVSFVLSIIDRRTRVLPIKR